MCGRYAASRKPEVLADLFGVHTWDPAEALAPDWNVAPTKDVYVAAFEKAAADLVAKRYLLPEDAKLLVERAREQGIRTAP